MEIIVVWSFLYYIVIVAPMNYVLVCITALYIYHLEKEGCTR